VAVGVDRWDDVEVDRVHHGADARLAAILRKQPIRQIHHGNGRNPLARVLGSLDDESRPRIPWIAFRIRTRDANHPYVSSFDRWHKRRNLSHLRISLAEKLEPLVDLRICSERLKPTACALGSASDALSLCINQ